MLLRTLLALLLAALLPGDLAAQAAPVPSGVLRLPWVYRDHMVLQRDQPIAVWGQAQAGAEVRVSFAGTTAVAIASDEGEWRTQLPPQVASSESRQLVVVSGQEQRRLLDVLVGEVWLCAGQSNMDFPLRNSTGGAAAAVALEQAGPIRLCDRTGSPAGGARRFSAEELANITPETFYSGTWQVATPESAASFSAVGIYFANYLADSLQGIPIGLIDVSVGGSTTEGWIPRERLSSDPTLAPLAEDYLATHLTHPFIRERVRTHLGEPKNFQVAQARPRHFFEPGFLYESALTPLAPFSLRGVLWYQGESNAHLPHVAGRLFRMLIGEWRRLWAQPSLPFYYVQLPAMGRPTWPELREVQFGCLNQPHTGMAVAIDVGHPSNVHPPNKRPVGERLARLALAQTYAQPVVAHGPHVVSIKRRDQRIELRFHQAAGLAFAPGRDPTGFEICGADRRFYPAHAQIVGDRVLLTSPQVPAPQDARYAWAPVPEWSLINAAGLPAAPFRTHTWRPFRVACIGDSITAGFGLDDPKSESYPARLQQRLGDGFQVRNFGHSGTCVVQSTMRGTWARAYRRNSEHQDALCFRPQIVISNLGINDIMAWPESGQDFVADYTALIADYRALSSKPIVLLWGPLAPLFKGQAFYGSPYEAQIHQAIARVATATQSIKVDLYEPLKQHSEWFPDYIHPNAAGADAAASVVYEALLAHGLARPIASDGR